MKVLRKAIVSIGVVLSVLFGSVGVAQTAQAYSTDYNNVVRYYGSCQWTGSSWMYSIENWVWRDYDWWEETFYGEHDRYVYWYTGYYYC